MSRIDKSLYRPVRKPRALPPKLTRIIKLKNGGNVENDNNVVPFVNPNEKPWYETDEGKKLISEAGSLDTMQKLIADAKVDRNFYLQQLGKVYSQKVLKDLTLRELDELLDYTIATGGI